jgi:UDP-N-acetylmuramoylalanine--D-glutamate ligase
MAIDLRGKRVSVIGAGRSGVSTAEVVKSLGGIPFVSDSAMLKDGELSRRLQALSIQTELGGHTERVCDSDMLIVSPGVPANVDIIAKAKSRGIAVWPEIELAYRLCRGRILGITGSNGKTTTTALVGEILKNAGYPTYVCGNIGFPFIAIADEVPANGFAVVELSSFQLEQIEMFRPNVAVFLNLTPDHLDRHKDLDEYTSAKMRIFENQKDSDTAVVNADDQTLKRLCDHLQSKAVWFSTRSPSIEGVWADPHGSIYLGKDALMKSSELGLKGEHNLSNACAAIAAAISLGISRDSMVKTLKAFAGVEHRLEPVRLIGGVSFINDSKGTNIDSVHWALKAVSAPVILIAGGKDKGGDFTALIDLVAQKVKLAILIGQATTKIETAWKNITKCVRAGTMEEAVAVSYASSSPGDTVLLSPGCASFDMFDNYEHRGRIFKKAVLELKSRVEDA